MLKKYLRPRTLYLALGCVIALAALIFTDPDHGVDTGMLLIAMLVCILAVAFTHWTRKALADYPESDMRALFKKAAENPVGAGLALIAQAIIIAALLLLFGSKVNAAPPVAVPAAVPAASAASTVSMVSATCTGAARCIPQKALTYAPVLRAEQRQFWPDHPTPWILAGLVEQESCVTLKSASCWSPTAKLKTAREEGAGLGQITRAFNARGGTRFDALADMRARYAQLAELSWENVYQRPDLQLRAIVLMARGNYRDIHRVVINPANALAFADAAYNGGMGGVQSDRRACALTKGCDPQQWFGHVENTCTKSRRALYGQRSACDINREHVRGVMRLRSAKYQQLMQA